jgi:hypothetical protein
MIDADRSSRNRQIRIFGLWAAGVLSVVLVLYTSTYVRIVSLDNMFDPKYGHRVGRREEYFSREFPSAQDIEAYLFDSTLLISKPPRNSRVYYFDRDYNYITWRGNLIEKGKWRSLARGWQVIRFGDRWRFAAVQSFCVLSLAMPADAQQDNCYPVETTQSLFTQGLGTARERRKGDVFGLSLRAAAPFELPDKLVTIDSLLEQLPGARE